MNPNPWIIIVVVMAAAVFGLDLLIRRKGFKNNTKEEKISLIVQMCAAGPYVFLSVLGMLWGLASGGAETLVGEILHSITLVMAGVFFIIAIIAMILSFVFRKKGKIKASIWVNIIALIYIVAVLGINYLIGALL